MVFETIYRHVLQHLKQKQYPTTLYVGPLGLRFPRVTTFRIPLTAFDGDLPFEPRSIDFIFGQLHGSLPPPFMLQQGLLQTCKRGLLTTRSPIAALTLDLPTEENDENDERYAIWTEPDTNRLCFLPLPWSTMVQLDMNRFESWKALVNIHPLHLFNLYEWEHAMELNLKVYPATLSARQCQDVLEEACAMSVQHTRWWMEAREL
jgi:hypothetical protein